MRQRWLAACVLALCACTADYYVRDADQEVGPLLERFQQSALGDRRQWVTYPLSAEESRPSQDAAPDLPPEQPTAEPVPDPGDPPADDEQPSPPPETGPPEDAAEQEPAPPPLAAEEDPNALQVDLATALRLAMEGNRDMQSRREGLYLSGLGYLSSRYAFTPQLGATMSYVWGDSTTGPANHSLGGSMGVSQILPTGGSVSLGTGLSTSRVGGPHLGDPDKGRSFSTSASVSLSQPLLRGFGREVALEGLVQAERNLLYAIRDFELFRQDFSIRIAEQYFDLVSQQKSLVIERQRYEDAVYDRRKAEALEQVDRGAIEDVFLARRGEQNAQSGLIRAQVAYQRAVDQFKVDLGLPVTTPIVIVEQEPPFQPVDLDPESSVQVALQNRLDIMNLRDQLEDTARGLRITRQNLLPDLDLNLDWSTSEGGGRRFADAVADAGSPQSRGGSLSFTLPLNQRGERDSYRSALFGFERAKRGFEETLDNLSNQIEDSIRSLEETAERIAIQEEIIAQDQRSIIRTEINIDRGQADNRALLEARNSVFNGRIELNNLRAQHFIQTLRLRKDLGILFIDEKGMWQ